MDTNNRQNIIDVTFISKWEEGEIKTKAKLDVSTGHVFDIDSVESAYECLIGEFITIEGDILDYRYPVKVEYPVETTNNEYFVTNPVLLSRIQRLQNSNTAPDADSKPYLDWRIELTAMTDALEEFLIDVNYKDPKSQFEAIMQENEEAMELFGVKTCEIYNACSVKTLGDMVAAAFEANKDSLTAIANLAMDITAIKRLAMAVADGGTQKPQFLYQPRVLVTVNGGVAEYIADDTVDVHVFDFDNYNKETDEGRAGMAVPARFRDLAVKRYRIPVEGEAQARTRTKNRSKP